MLNYQNYFVLTDSGRVDFSDYKEAYKFYCDNLSQSTYIELVGVYGIVGHTLMYNMRDEDNGDKI